MFTAEELEAKSEEGKHQNPIAWLLGRGIALLFLGVWRFVRLFWSSLLYLLVARFFWAVIPSWGGPLVAVLWLVVPLMLPQTRRYSFIIRDWTAYRARVAEREAVAAANELLGMMGLIVPGQELYGNALYPAADGSEVVLDYRDPIPGCSLQKLTDASKAFKSTVSSAKSVRLEETGNGLAKVHFIVADVLDDGVTIHEPKPLDVSSMSLEIGRDAYGAPLHLKLKDTAGMLIGGVPGSGKSAAINSFLGSFALDHDDVSLTVIDCKGGQDFSAYQSQADTFVSEASDYHKVRDVLATLVDEMNERVATNAEVLGESNFWNVDPQIRRAKGVKLRLTIIDEAQELFAPQTDKESKQLHLEIAKLATTLVKRGRSAGFCTIFATQKPTADAIPTGLRDNVNIHMALRVNTAEAEKSIFGYVPDDVDSPRATQIPSSRKGGFVMENEGGMRVMGRTFYFPETELRDYLTEATETASLK